MPIVHEANSWLPATLGLFEYVTCWSYAGGIMITAVLLALLCSAPDAAGATLSPDALGAPPQSDESPTAWACTVETLRAGRECVFEAEVTSSTDVHAQASEPSDCGGEPSASGDSVAPAPCGPNREGQEARR